VSTWWILVERRERQQQEEEKDKEKQHARSNRIASHPVSSRANSAFCNHQKHIQWARVVTEIRNTPRRRIVLSEATIRERQFDTRIETTFW
jgi:hypothetical protein